MSWSVTFASALTTTTGCGEDFRTSWHTRRMAAASATEVPPNFITTHSAAASLRSNIIRSLLSPCDL